MNQCFLASQLLRYDGNRVSHRNFSKPCCGKDFSKPYEIQYFELWVLNFDSYVYYLTRGFIASIRAFNFLTRVYNLTTRGFLISQIVLLLTRGFELVTRNSCFTFPPIFDIINYSFLFKRHFLNFRVSVTAKGKRSHQIKNCSRIHNL